MKHDFQWTDYGDLGSEYRCVNCGQPELDADAECKPEDSGQSGEGSKE